MKEELDKIRTHVGKLEKAVHFLAAALVPPILYDSNQQHRGFRYMKPSIHHFCVLKAVRAVSGLNAAIVLAEKGFIQEICVLIRTIIECTTHIEYALAGYENGVLAEDQAKFIEKFFSDFRRNAPTDFSGSAVRQEDVHKKVARFLDDGLFGEQGSPLATPTKELFSNIYRVYSNYIHGRYPETMDMFGGSPAQFHLNGMPGTPKDSESIEIIKIFANSVSLSLGFMIQKSDRYDEMKSMSEFKEWFVTGSPSL